MPSIKYSTLLSLTTAASAAASPLVGRQATCTPDLSSPVSIAITGTGSTEVREWRKSTVGGINISTKGGSLETPDWVFEEVTPGVYYIKPVGDETKAITVIEDNPLSLQPFSETDAEMRWKVTCNICNPVAVGAPFATGCKISSAARGWCAQLLRPDDNYLVRALCGYSIDGVEFWLEQ